LIEKTGGLNKLEIYAYRAKVSLYQNEYFEILLEFFIGVTGKTPEAFCETKQVFQGNDAKSRKIFQSFLILEEKFKKLYEKENIECFKAAKNIDCFKTNLRKKLNATRKSILFSDIVLIPDAVMPWLETEREHEQI